MRNAVCRIRWPKRPPSYHSGWLSDLFTSGKLKRESFAVSVSSTYSGSSSNVLTRQGRSSGGEGSAGGFYTKNTPTEWIEIAFPSDFEVREYGFRYGYWGSDGPYFMRSWDVEGYDGAKWEVLKQHRSDTTMSAKDTFVSWEIDGGRGKRYRKLRLSMKGPNAYSSGSHYHMMVKDVDIRI